MTIRGHLFRLAFCAAMWAAATAVFVAAAGFLVAALWFVVSDLLPPAQAALATGLGALAAGVVIVLLGYAVRGRSRPGGESLASLIEGAEAARDPEVAVELGALVGREAAALISAHPGRAAVAAAAVGFVVGASPRLRGALREMLK